MLKAKLLCSSILVSSLVCSAQPDLQKTIPLSPNAASLAKFGEMPVGSFTGVPEISIPLYTVQSRELKLPIELSYHAGGNKVETISSWVGLGWAITTPPTISRTVRGLPDEGRGGFFEGFNGQTVKELFSGNQSTYENFLRLVKDGEADAEPDVFFYSLPGKSGKFYYDQERKRFIVHPFENIQVDFDLNSKTFRIITEDGVQYHFLSQEKCYTSSTNTPTGAVITSWQVTKMVTANRTDSLIFHYSPEVQYSINTNSVTRYIKFLSNGECLQAPQLNFQSDVSQTISYNNVLASIEFLQGFVQFNTAGSEREDLQGGHALESIKVFNSQGEQVKHFHFAQTYLQSQTPGVCASNDGRERKWLMLSELQEISADGKINKYRIDYKTDHVPPCRTSPAQDHWGFYNEATNNQNLIPSTVVFFQGGSPNGNLVDGADRNINPDATQFGIIERLTYPTGGYTEYTFENNRVSDALLPPAYIGAMASLEGEETITTNHYAGSFEIDNPPDPFLNGNNPNGGAFVNISAGGFGCDLSGGANACATVVIKGISPSNSTLPWIFVTGKSYNVYLPNGSYAMDATFQQDPPRYNGFFLTINWNKINPDGATSVENRLAPGLRIRQIKTHDGGSHANDIVKKFHYTTTFTSNVSSGKSFGTSFFNYQDDDVEQHYIWTDPYLHFPLECVNYFKRLRSYSNIQAVSHSGSYAGYETVFTELEGATSNGLTEQQFLVEPDFQSVAFPYPPAQSNEHLRGLPTQTIQYRKEGSDYVPVTRTVNEYAAEQLGESFGLKLGSLLLFSAASNIDLPLPPLPEFRNPYYLQSFQSRLLRTTQFTYDGANPARFVKRSTSFEYSPVHFQVVKETSSDSKGQVKEMRHYYPQDLTLSGDEEAARQLLISQHRIATVLRQEETLASTIPVEGTLSSYKTTGLADGQVFPSEIRQKHGSGSFESKVLFNRFSPEGNLLEQQKANDAKHSYIWGYNSTYPVAEIVGKSYDEVLSQSGIDLNVINSMGTSEAVVRQELNKLRSLSNCLVTTYTYKPLVGMTSMTDPNGRTTYYEYDGFGRLSLVRDQQQHILKKICYNYAGQAEDCALNSGPAQIWYNEAINGTFYSQNCVGQTPLPYPVSIPAGTYSSTASQPAANALAAQAAQQLANQNGGCQSISTPATTIYARLEVVNYYEEDDGVNAFDKRGEVWVKFYADAACTQALTLQTPLTVNWSASGFMETYWSYSSYSNAFTTTVPAGVSGFNLAGGDVSLGGQNYWYQDGDLLDYELWRDYYFLSGDGAPYVVVPPNQVPANW